MNPTFIGGILLSLGAIAGATIIDGNSFGVLFGPSAVVLVFFGTIGASSVGYNVTELKQIPGAITHALKGSPPDHDATINRLVSFANTARREGVLALERRLDEVDDHFQRAGLQLVVDGVDPDQVRQFLEIEIAAADERHQVGISFFKTMAGYAPTMGLLGTIIGLVNMLANLSDPSQLGKGMALALLTTLYGVLFANLVFQPVAERLTRANSAELSSLDMALDGILAVQAGTSPRMLAERLETYLAPERRQGYEARIAAGDPATAGSPVAAPAA
ncbi:MAG TPA: motility protein A [Egibacteraceae bacterium]|nr:motility protein A [Egibacteraceae bacterium]